MDLTYEMRRALRQDVGPQAAAVFDVLAHYDVGDDGVEMANGELASESGVSPKTAQRAIAKLREVGVLKYENQFRDNRQVANRYQPQYDRIGGGHPDRPGGQGDQANRAIATTSNERELVKLSTTNTNQITSLISEHISWNPPASVIKEGLRPSGLGVPTKMISGTNARDGDCVDDAELRVVADSEHQMSNPGLPWPPRNSPMPMSATKRARKVLDAYVNSMWLVVYFEGRIIHRDNHDRLNRGRKPIDEVPQYRKDKWFDSAFSLVHSHPLHEVVNVIDWVFDNQHSYLPCTVLEHSETPSDDRLTRLRQVKENYDLLVEAMHTTV